MILILEVSDTAQQGALLRMEERKVSISLVPYGRSDRMDEISEINQTNQINEIKEEQDIENR
jgi:hypothetical protein